MRRGTRAATALSLALLVIGLAEPSGASEHGRRPGGCTDYTQDWPRRQYWQWDNRPIWDDPWLVLTPNFFGSPQPHLVPADIWARQWHPPWLYPGRLHRGDGPRQP